MVVGLTTGMFDYLDKLRAKPVHVRKRIALLATATLSFFVASVWVGTLNTERIAPTTPTVAEVSTRSPWGVVSDMLKHTKGEMGAAVSEATAQFTQVTAGSVAYDPSKDAASPTNEASLRNAESDAQTIEDAPVFSGILDAGTAGGAVHTRPGSLDEATGTVAGDVIQ